MFIAMKLRPCTNQTGISVSRWSRRLATAIDHTHRARLSKFEPDQFVDYTELVRNIETVGQIVKRPLSYAEKILLAHTDNLESVVERGTTELKLRPRRVACQDATAQMAIIQFMSAGLDSTAVPTTVHCDHLIVGKNGGETDLPMALEAHKEVYDFLSSACRRYNMGFWKPGAGIIHQIVLENYAYPGGMMVGTDSHTPNAGGLGMIAIGVGGADAVDVMAGMPFIMRAPKVIGVNLTGKLSGWATPKDIINKLASLLTVKGGTGSIIEFFGPGAATLSATGMCTVTNMGAETGATTSIFPPSPAMSAYLNATNRPDMAQALSYASHALCADQGVEYDRIINIDLSSLEPRINGPFTPDISTPISKFKQASEENKWPEKLTAGLIGSCTNSSFEDMSRAASLAKQAIDAGLKPKMPLLISPGSEQTRETLKANGILNVFDDMGATMLTNACGPCCGSWDRQDQQKGKPNSIITSYNRNFTGRLDGNPATHIFLSSPEMVMAKIFSDDIGFDPINDSLKTPNGDLFRFRAPDGVSLPTQGYESADHVYSAPPTDRQSVIVEIAHGSERLQRLKPFTPWSGKDFDNCTILIKVKGKCTTDHITPAGKWFRYRGHLSNISNNTLIGAVNAENNRTNHVTNWLTGKEGSVPETARDYRDQSQPWIVIADHNYGEGSSREHAALQPRHLGSVAIIAKSFARIHETNLKKQGLLALTFTNEADYDRLLSSDRVSILGLSELAPGQNVKIKMTPTVPGNKSWITEVKHTMSLEEIEYFKAGSALNLMAARANDMRHAATA
ncbi:putative aconitase [Xylaria cf. heliscus]|nr:putative aconitase [Xylaria cf. heliscus]